MDVNKRDFITGAVDGIDVISTSTYTVSLKSHYNETGEIDWYLAGVIIGRRLSEKPEPEGLSAHRS